MVRDGIEHDQLAVVMGGAVESHIAEAHQSQAVAADRSPGIQDLGRSHVAAQRVRYRSDGIAGDRRLFGLCEYRRAAEREQKNKQAPESLGGSTRPSCAIPASRFAHAGYDWAQAAVAFTFGCTSAV